MTERQFKVVFQPSGRNVFVLGGTKVMEAAGRAGMGINMPCGGQGTCGKCRVQVTSVEKPEPNGVELRVFSEGEIAEGWRLGCQTAVFGDMTVFVPDESLSFTSQQILAKSRGVGDVERRPAVRKVYFELAEPSREDSVADLERIFEVTGDCKIGLEQLRGLPKFLRGNGFKGTAVLLDHHIAGFETGDTTEECYGAAFDIGTSTIVGTLLDLNTGVEVAISSMINPQVSYGDDVLSRIQHASSCAECLLQMQSLVIGAIDKMIGSMCEDKGIERERVYEVVLAGNTTMEHLVCGIDPVNLGQVPFVPAHSKGLMFSATELGVSINHKGMVYVFPIIGGFVGGDISAGVLVAELKSLKGTTLFIDVGTNGEIVIAKDGELWAASTAAGPALEGARISCGMRATHGAIEKVVFDGDVRVSTIGDATAIGICGSGLIDLAAELLNSGVILSSGKMVTAEELSEGTAEGIRRRLVVGREGQMEFVVSENSGHKDIKVAVSQRDVRELQLAVGAIRAGIEIMLRKTGTKAEDLDRVYVAGGFGSFIRRNNAQRIGLLPSRVPHERISFIGNSSLDGAQLALLSVEARKRGEETAKEVTHVELSLDMDFQMEFANAMVFPEA